jgi:hypothetical protein
MKTKMPIIVAAVALLFGVLVSLNNLTPMARAASDSIDGTLTVGSDQLQVVVVSVNGKSAGRTVTTTNAKNKVTFDVQGVGLVTITDDKGDVLYQYDKVTSAPEEITADINLPGEPGEYKLTVQIASPQYGVSQDTVTLIYESAPFVPNIPGVPSTGYLKIGGFSIPISSALIWLLIVAAAGAAIWYLTNQSQNRRAPARATAKKTRK